MEWFLLGVECALEDKTLEDFTGTRTQNTPLHQLFKVHGVVEDGLTAGDMGDGERDQGIMVRPSIRLDR